MRPLLLIVLLTACSEPASTPDAIPPLDCGDALALEVRVPGGEYRSIDDAGDGAELVLGFQGFRYVYVRARLDEDPGAVAAIARIEVDGAAPRSQPIGQLAFSPDAVGVVSAPVQVFFNDEALPSLVDQGVTLELWLGDRCRAAGHTVLRYDPSCVEGPDGVPICDDAGDAP